MVSFGECWKIQDFWDVIARFKLLEENKNVFALALLVKSKTSHLGHFWSHPHQQFPFGMFLHLDIIICAKFYLKIPGTQNFAQKAEDIRGFKLILCKALPGPLKNFKILLDLVMTFHNCIRYLSVMFKIL